MCIRDRYYGNLVLSAATGNVFKTMPSAALFVDGSFTATRGTASSLAFTALSNFTIAGNVTTVSYTHLRAHETVLDLVCRLLLETKITSTLHPEPLSVHTNYP